MDKVWQVIGESVAGFSHLKSGLPNQDAIGWYYDEEGELPLVLALSDGHGSHKSFRSNKGAEIAVEVALNLVKGDQIGLRRDIFKDASFLDIRAIIKQAAEERIPKIIVEQWRKIVEKNLLENPFTEKERDGVMQKGCKKDLETIENDNMIAYGATLLMVIVTEGFILYLQIGDGDIITVLDSDNVTRPIPGDDRLLGNETTSLCLSNAWRDFRHNFQIILNKANERVPRLILVSSDGYSNSFREDREFLTIGSDYLGLIKSEGIEKVKENLKSWLEESTRLGSGDDITLGLLYRSQ